MGKSLEVWTGRAWCQTHIYLLLCNNANKIMVKVGVSDLPMNRLEHHKTSCPFHIKMLMATPCTSRKAAFKIESAILASCVRWRTHGEWLQFELADKPEFNEAIRVAFSVYDPGRVVKWSRIILTNKQRPDTAKGFFSKLRQKRLERREPIAT